MRASLLQGRPPAGGAADLPTAEERVPTPLET